jgi:DNA polymerase-3 subunit delta'
VPPSDVVPLIGHTSLRARLTAAMERRSLPGSVLLQGPPGVGKQRLALWLAETLLCSNRGNGRRGELKGCGTCQSCRFSATLVHPDLHWVFPRPRSKDPDPSPAEVRRDYADAIAERIRDGLLYAPPDGSDGIYVATVRALMHDAAVTPAIGQRKVIVVGDAERMVPQEGADMAANAFLKMLEEPPSDTTIVLTSSVPGALLPTIRSRVAAIRVPPLSADAMTAWLEHPRVRDRLKAEGAPASDDERMRHAAGSPGRLLAMAESRTAVTAAQSLVDAATGPERPARFVAALRQGNAGARGAFADTLSALTTLLHGELRSAVDRRDVRVATASCRAIASVEEAKQRTETNVSPQLITATLLRDMAASFGRGA